MLTASTAHAGVASVRVRSLSRLIREGWTHSQVRATLDARRWQRFGNVIVLHNAALTQHDRHAVALLNCGPGALLTSFTAAEVHGLTGWSRGVTHVLVPGGRHVVHVPAAPARLHFVADWSTVRRSPGRRLHQAAPALTLAAASLRRPRSACGLLAAGVQQRLVTSTELPDEVATRSRLRHRAVLLGAVGDIAQGAQALSEIDFARLCRRAGLPEPARQAVRVEPSGRRRYLDVEWTLAGGRRVVAEIDGALHLAAQRWWSDQLRQNELVIAGDAVLRFPSVVVRCEDTIVMDQLRRMLL